MSLQVWLPLNGDLNNQGLSNITGSQLGTISWPAGKIGKSLCAGNGSQVANGISYNSNLVSTLGAEFSAAVWVCPKGNHVHYNGTFLSSGDWNNQCWSFGVSQDNTRVDIFGAGYNHYITCSVPVNTWTHLACSHKNGITKLYKNGVYVGEASGEADALVSDASNFCVGRETYAGGYFSFNGYLNDVRIYNHALSAKEVKEISKGLICHLPLNGGEGGVNLLKGIAECTATSAGVVVSGDSLTYDSSLLPLNSLIGRTFTFTYDYSVEGTKKNATGDYSKDRFGAHLSLTYKDSTGATKTDYPGASYLEVSGTGRAVQTYTCSSTWTEITSLTIALQGYNQPASGNSNTWYIKNFKIEVGNVDTGYSINPNTSGTSVKLTDCSGYGHHGIPSVLPPAYCKETTRHDASYDFTGGKKVLISNLPTSGLANSYTISWWAKTWSFSNLMFWGFSNGNRLNYYGGLYCNTGDGSSNPYRNNGTTITTPTNDVWHHYVMVGNGSTSLLYVDGNLYGTALNYKSITGSSIYLNGWDSSSNYNFNGYMSDFRIYATALSANDIKELYQIPISIDKNGDMFSLSYNENGTKHSFYKTGNVEGALWEKDEPFSLIKNNIPFRENLFKNSNNFGLTGSDFPSVSTRTIGKVVVSSNSLGNAYAWIQGSIEGGMTSIFNSTKTMTLSIDIKVENVTNANAYGLIAIDYRKGDHSAVIGTAKKLIMDGKWHRYNLPITANNGGQVQSLLCLANFQNLNGATIYYKNIKYEEGATGSPWCPSKSEGFTSNMATMVAPISANQFYEV